MAVSIHFVTVGPMKVSDDDNTVYYRSDSNKTIKECLNFREEHRVIPDVTKVPNSANSPTIQDYLNLEAVSGYSVIQVAQTFIVTQKVS